MSPFMLCACPLQSWPRPPCWNPQIYILAPVSKSRECQLISLGCVDIPSSALNPWSAEPNPLPILEPPLLVWFWKQCPSP